MNSTQTEQMVRNSVAGAAMLLVAVLCAGCRITTTKGEGKKDVSINTPLGGMQVKTNPGRVLEKVGLPQYPGSVLVDKKGEHNGADEGSADVDMSFGSFHLRVLAVGFQTSDSQQAVEAFYRPALAKYSDVIACRNHQPVGQPAKTGLGLTCEDEKGKHGMHGSSTGDDADALQLKAGSGAKQHIVAIKPQDDGTRIELVALDLPKGD